MYERHPTGETNRSAGRWGLDRAVEVHVGGPGTVNWVELAIDEAAADEDLYLSAEERFQVAMAIQ